MLDVALQRQAFLSDSTKVIDWAELNPKQAAVAWHSIANLAYLVKQDARAFIPDLLVFVEVASGNTATVRQALTLPTKDLEDALQAAAAFVFGADIIVTRNISDFKNLPIKSMTAAEFARIYMTEMDDQDKVA